MAKRIRAMPIYVNGRKIGEAESDTYEHRTNDEAQLALDGYVGHSDGADMTTASFSAIVPTVGLEAEVKSLIVNKEYCDLGVDVDGGVEMVTGRFVTRSYTSDAKTGALKGTFNFEGGAPDVF